MMTLEDAARFFDENTFTDTYGTATFKGQVLPFSDSTRSGSATKRRILEVGSAVSIPTKRTISNSGTVYLVASGNRDLYLGDVIRIKYPILPVTSQCAIRSIGQVLTGVGGTTDAYVSPSYIRRNILEEQSEYLGGYEVYFSSYYYVPQGTIIIYDSRYYRTRENSRVDDTGFGVVESVELEAPIDSMTFQSQGTVYNPADDDYTPPVAVPAVDVFVEYGVMDYQHDALGFKKIEEGDKTISFLKSDVAAVGPGDTIGDYRILSVQDNTTFWSTHARPV